MIMVVFEIANYRYKSKVRSAKVSLKPVDREYMANSFCSWIFVLFLSTIMAKVLSRRCVETSLSYNGLTKKPILYSPSVHVFQETRSIYNYDKFNAFYFLKLTTWLESNDRVPTFWHCFFLFPPWTAIYIAYRLSWVVKISYAFPPPTKGLELINYCGSLSGGAAVTYRCS